LPQSKTLMSEPLPRRRRRRRKKKKKNISRQ